LAALERDALLNGDDTALIDLYASLAAESPSASVLLRLSALRQRVGDVGGAVGSLHKIAEIESALPDSVAACMAQALGEFDLAHRLLGGATSTELRAESARLLTRKLKRAHDAVSMYRELLEDDASPSIAFGMARAAQAAGIRPAMGEANRVLANGLSGPAKAAYATWAAGLYSEDGADVEAAALYEDALVARPGGTDAFDGCKAALMVAGTVDGLKALYEAHRPGDRRGLAEALEVIGQPAEALPIWNELVATRGFVPWFGYAERAAMAAEDWSAAYAALESRAATVQDTGNKQTLGSKKRWLLAEKLAETDMAWELYRTLHEESPQDHEVTEALARIAGARGETSMAVEYLIELADGTQEPSEAARYRRRIGDAYEAAEDHGSARQAYLDALDHVHDDADALAGLKRLAEKDEDWSGLIQVLQRETALVTGARKTGVLREIARVTQERLGDALVAMDAWRAVLDNKSHDIEALQALMSLAETLSDWGPFVDAGSTLATISTGPERSALLRRVGIVSEEHLNPDEAMRYYELAISEDPPDLEAARRLQRVYAMRGDWPGTIRTLQLQSDLVTDIKERTDFLEKAARIESETRHDRDAAAEIYARVLGIDKNNERALRFQAFHLFEAGRFDEALPVCRRLEPVVEAGQDMDDFDVRMELSQFYFYFAQMLSLADEGE
jgi:tetratricopeptide (TPR) repeat protein